MNGVRRLFARRRALFGRTPWGGILVGVGVGTLLVGALVVLQPWYASEQWRSSPEAARAQRNADAPQPIWLTPGPSDATVTRATATPPALSRTPAVGIVPVLPPGPAATSQPPPTAAPRNDAAVQDAGAPAQQVASTPTPAVSLLKLGATQFQFLDPPEPGAKARLTISVHNPTGLPGGPISLVLPLDWLAGYRIEALDPAPLDGTQNGTRLDNALHLTFEGPDAQSDVALAVDVVAIDEVIDAPMLHVLDANAAEIGSLRPPTEAPPPRPGPIYSIDIPNLHLHAGVVPVDWEPPVFVVGQLRASAHVTQGNSVLVGHVRGAAGYNVFDRLDQLAPGDKVMASSRGETYNFVVSQTQVLPEDDTLPTDATSSPRLTLMTCAGSWNPLTRDYSDRLWVIAVPAEAAAAAIAAESKPTPLPRPTQISARGGLGNTDADLAAAFGPPAGESAAGLAVYHASGPNATLEHKAQFADLPSGSVRRALLVADLPPPDAPLAFDTAVGLSRNLLPDDAQPRASGPEGNPRFVVERFTSPALAAALPAEWFTEQHAQPGDLLVIYARRPDGRITSVVVGIGDDAQALLSRV
ncbi:MAG: sortase [Chloroflexota bacterium]|nr:sortase [Chloroflexota bacterium]